MQAISLGDSLSFSFRKKDGYVCSDPSLKWNEKNLIYQAVELFRRYTGISTPLHIEHIKMIPMQAGLGGGSSNAATVLWALNHLFSSPLSDFSLKDLAARIGSDVAFFLSSGAAFCQSRGEYLFPIAPIPLEGFLAVPSFGLCTKTVFQTYSRLPKPSHSLSQALKNYSLGKTVFYNDLQTAAFSINPQMETIQHQLQQSFDHVVMTGSGSSFFCMGRRKAVSINSLKFYPFCCIFRKQQNWYSWI